MSVVREGFRQRYTCLGTAYLVVASALQWSRGGPPMRDPGSGSISAVSDLLAFYGAWYGAGFLLLVLGWWRATHGDASHRRSTPAE